MRNKPLNSVQVQGLPLGYNITGAFPNKRMRHARSPRGVPRKIQIVMKGLDQEGKHIIPMWVNVNELNQAAKEQVKENFPQFKRKITNARVTWVINPDILRVVRDHVIIHNK